MPTEVTPATNLGEMNPTTEEFARSVREMSHSNDGQSKEGRRSDVEIEARAEQIVRENGRGRDVSFLQ